MDRLNNGDYVVHYKFFNNTEEEIKDKKYIYRIIETEAYTAEDDPKRCVIYKALYSPYKTWIRPYDEFMSKIHIKDSIIKYRFSRIGIMDGEPVIFIVDELKKLYYPKLIPADLDIFNL